jgi:hypothetical protein
MACSLIWLICTYRKQEWGNHYALMAASCALVVGLDWFSMGIGLPVSLGMMDRWLNVFFMVLGAGTVIHLHRTEKLNVV